MEELTERCAIQGCTGPGKFPVEARAPLPQGLAEFKLLVCDEHHKIIMAGIIKQVSIGPSDAT